MPSWIRLQLETGSTQWRWRLLDIYAEELARGYAKTRQTAIENARELARLYWPGATLVEGPDA